ncbi:hypothetical protein EAG_11547 [Camponotus floridanus]|uniref:Uncharacterized protein n=1 Tax=Camponotus floridanus TaxID=104421 RepID=E2AAP0_CAMFO|nr:hypothetical protein EAG_11547 [Camponotus floridanus]
MCKQTNLNCTLYSWTLKFKVSGKSFSLLSDIREKPEKAAINFDEHILERIDLTLPISSSSDTNHMFVLKATKAQRVHRAHKSLPVPAPLKPSRGTVGRWARLCNARPVSSHTKYCLVARRALKTN